MTPERWQQVDEIFQAAIDLDPALRAAFLETSCAGDEELRSEVESLISCDEQGLSFIDEPAYQVAAGLLVSESAQLTEGQHIGHYEITGLIGKGGMGEVYLAKDKLLNRRIALKLLPADYAKHKDRLRRFQQEAQAASGLNHPNILTIHEVGEVDGQQFIATEFVDGETLRERMRRASLSLPETLDIATQVASALAAAHRAGITHRDIKPENIMLRPDGYVKVLDFGLAKLTEQYEPPTVAGAADNVDVSSGLVMGTVKYMSPEQARGLSVDPRSDIFSLGVVLYEMVTGRTPFKGESTGELIKSILKDQPPRLAEYLPDAPEELQPIISKALAEEKSRRYQTAEDLLVDLKALGRRMELGAGSRIIVQKADGREISTEVFGRETTLSIEYVASQIRQHKTRAVLGLLALVILVGSVTYPLKKLFSKRAAPFERIEITKLTSSGEVRGNAAISRDGKYVAYALKTSGQRSLWIKDLATNNDVQMIPPTDGGFNHLVFTPDSKYLYYDFAEKVGASGPSGRLRLYRIPVSGGAPEKLLDNIIRPIAFSPDGRQFAFSRGDLTQGLTTLDIANADGTGVKTVASRKAPDYFPSALLSWSPDGKSIACIAVNASDGYDRVFEVNIETGAQKPLTSQKWDGGIGSVAWLSDSHGLLLTAGTASSQAIWFLSYPDAELRRITNDTNFYIWLSLTADSRSLVTGQTERFSEIWIAPDGDASRARRITPGRADYELAWTADGRIVYTSRAKSGNTDIWIMNADGTKQEQLTKDAHNNIGPSVTPDGRFIVFKSDRAGAEHIWRMDINGGNQKQLTFGAVERNPNCSPDSKRVVYNSWESGKAAVWKLSVEGGTPERLTDVACFGPVVSPDGNLIACDSGKRSPAQRLIIPFEGGKPVKALDVPTGGSAASVWTSDGKALTYLATRDGVTNIWIQPIDGSPPKQLTNFKSDQRAASEFMASYAWSPDGKQLAFNHAENKADVVLIRDLR